jgi:CubicO group peptidase (beta-lactamase class C family)
LKKSLEDLMEEYVFRPLGMPTGHYLTTATLPDKLDGPWPHHLVDGRPQPIPPRLLKGISRGPAGATCLSIVDLGQWASAHLQGENGVSVGLRASTIRELHRQLEGVRGTMSFGRKPEKWARGEVLNHGGNDGSSAAHVWIVPQENFAFCIATNCNSLELRDAETEVRELLVKRARDLQKKKKPPRPGRPR